MKKEIGKRSYTEMYLITKQDKNLLDKCVTSLGQNELEKSLDDFTIKKDVIMDEQNESVVEKNEKNLTDEEELKDDATKNISDKNDDKVEKISQKKNTETKPAFKKSKVSGRFQKQNQSQKNTSSKFALLPKTHSPIKTRQSTKKKNIEKKKRNDDTENYSPWTQIDM